CRHHWVGTAAGTGAPVGIRISSRADFYKLAAGGRNQSHAAQDAIGASGSHAGTPRDGRRQIAPLAGPVSRGGNAKSHRTGRDLPIAGSATGSVHVLALFGLSAQGRGDGGR